MKNFICVINKEKIYAYVVSVCTIVTLFFMSNFISKFDETEMTSSNVVENVNSVECENEINNNIISNEVNNVIE